MAVASSRSCPKARPTVPVDVLAIARILGAETADLRPGHIGEAVAESIGRPGVRVFRLRTERARNVTLHGLVHGLVQDAVVEALR